MNDHLYDGDDLEEIAVLGREPEELEGHADGRQAFRVCRDVVTNLRAQLAKVGDDKLLSAEAIGRRRERVIADAAGRLRSVAATRDTLARLMVSIRKRHDLGQVDPATRAAIWGRLPPSRIEVSTSFRDALDRGDANTMNAILAMPSAFENALDPETLAELAQDRFEKEEPELAAQVERAGVIHGVIEAACHGTSLFIEGLGRADRPQFTVNE